MAIYHLSMKPMTRSAGRSSVAAAAYRAGECLENARDGLTHDFTHRQGVEHTEIVLPAGVDAAWVKDRSALWNAAEAAEKRKDARVAREIEVALPHELVAEERLALTREFAQGLADRYGVAVDFAIHKPHLPTDERNHHAHLLLTTRRIESDRLGEKSVLEWENKKLAAADLPTTHAQLREIRAVWEERANLALARAGREERIDHRSHAARGIEIEPTQHAGVHATQMERRGKDVSRLRLEAEAAQRNAELIREKPEQVLELITNEKSVFDRYDVARALHRYVEGPEAFQVAYARVMASPALIELQGEARDAQGRTVERARYSTREMVGIERSMAASAERLAEGGGYGVAGQRVEVAIAARPHLAAEQRTAIEHVTGDERIAVVVGLAGAGKSTMLVAAREAWEGQGHRVHGAALSGKAAEGLEESAGIGSRTLASWERSWARGFDRLGRGDVLVVDEAGMVGSRMLARVIGEAEAAGAKVVLVGDPEQLQPIGAGAAFRAVAERVGFTELAGVRRQREDWQRVASVEFGRHRTAAGLAAYEAAGAVRLEATIDAARAAIVREVMADRQARPDGSRLVLAHRRVEVRALNDAIRAARQERGELAGERPYQTAEGERAFAAGDRVLFRENHRGLGVKNGMLGTVERADDGRLAVRLDSGQGPGRGRAVEISMADYAAVDHGYAATIHKAQGATVDRAWVLASGSMDRHLTYVAMTRHREAVQLYGGRDEFRDVPAMAARLSRSGAKETTLDYERARYGERRGLELDSEIVVRSAEQGRAVERPGEGARKRGRFDGLRLGSGGRAGAPTERSGTEQARFAGLQLPAGPRPPAALKHEAPDRLPQAVERFAQAWSAVARMRAQGLPVLEHQQAALREAGAALDAVRPQATADLRSALKHEPHARRVMAEITGPKRAAQLVAHIERETRVRRDPTLAPERQVREQEQSRLREERERMRQRSRDRGLSR